MSNKISYSDAALAGLREDFSGVVLHPGDDGYEKARRVHNGMIDRRPAVIARCLNAVDVQEALAFAIQESLEIAVKGGGHNVAGRAVCDDGMMIDLSLMKGVWVDPERRCAQAQAGVNWGEFNRATQLHGLATTGGAVSATGVAGLTLGGGFGYLMGKHGYTIDNLLSVELVTADGQVLQASDRENSELFWGLRGGGGNFGIATSFEFSLHPVGPIIQGGLILHSFDAADGVLNFYRDLTADPPDEMALLGALTHTPDGTKAVAMIPAFFGEEADAKAAMAPIKAYGDPFADQIGDLPYTKLNQLVDGGFPPLTLNYWKSCFLEAFDDEVIAILIDQFARTPTRQCRIIIERFHGATLRPVPSSSAFPHRKAGYSILIIGIWLEASLAYATIEWARETYNRLQPHSREAAYSNYFDDDEDLARIKLAYGDNFERLQALKDRYDPQNIFHLNQNIPPSGS